MRTFTYEIESVTTKPEFTVRQPERDGLEIISNRTGNHYTLLEGMAYNIKTKQNFASDFMFIMRLVQDDDGDYMYADDAFVNYVAGAEYINQLDDWSLQGVFEYITDYENKQLQN